MTQPRPPRPIKTCLKDGTQVLIRPVIAADKEQIREGLHQLSRESRYRRFMAPVTDLTDEQLRYLTEIDYCDHMAWGARDLSKEDGGRGIGLARYVRISDEPTVAEAAITVLDSYQGRGLGTLLLNALSHSAVKNQIYTFRAYVLEENTPMMHILTGLGAQIMSDGAGIVRVETPLPTSTESLPKTPTAEVFRAVAQQLVPPLAVRFLHDAFLPKVVRLFSRKHK